MENDVDLIKNILPNVQETEIIRALEETGDFGLAVKILTPLNSPIIRRKPQSNKRITVHAHNLLPQIAIDGIHEATKSIRSLNIEVSEAAPQFTISVSFLGKPCKPMIYVEPEPFDQQFCSNIESHSIILSQDFSDNTLQLHCSINSLVLLQFTKENVSTALKHVLTENGIIGEGYGSYKIYKSIWNQMLRVIPMISGTYADAITEEIENPYAASSLPIKPIVSKSGHRVPQRIINTLKLFYSSDDPNEKLETGPSRKRST